MQEWKQIDDRIAARFESFKELNAWFDSLGAYRGACCPLIEEIYVVGCYKLFRREELRDTVGDMYTEFEHTHKKFVVLEEVPTTDPDFDLCALPLWICDVDGEQVALYPEEIFVNY